MSDRTKARARRPGKASPPADQASALRIAFAPATDAKNYPYTSTHHIENLGDVHLMVRTPQREGPPDAILRRWLELAAEMSRPDIELTIENFAIVLVTFRQLERAGVAFDPMFSALMNLLKSECFDADDDSDSDAFDIGLHDNEDDCSDRDLNAAYAGERRPE